MDDLVEQKRDKLTDLCRQYGVAMLELFGSAASGEGFDPHTSPRTVNAYRPCQAPSPCSK